MNDEAANSCLALAELSTQAIFSFDIKSCKFIYCNPAFREYVQLKDDSIPAKDISFLIHPEDEEYVRESYEDLLRTTRKRTFEFRLILSDDRVRSVRVEAFNTVIEKKRQVITGMVEDITAYKEHSDTLNKFSNKKNSILNILSHDILGPLGTIQNLSGILNRKFANEDNLEISKFLNSIEKISKQSISMVRNLLTREFLETADAELVRRRTNIVAALAEMVEQYKQTEEVAKVTFNFSATKKTIIIDIDEAKLMQALNNLISNALKFTPANGNIEISVMEEKDTVLFTIADNGIGIPEDLHATLFDKFSLARRPGLHGEASTGLGMSIIKTIIEWHHGEIWFESKEHVGTSFYVRLPCK